MYSIQYAGIIHPSTYPLQNVELLASSPTEASHLTSLTRNLCRTILDENTMEVFSTMDSFFIRQLIRFKEGHCILIESPNVDDVFDHTTKKCIMVSTMYCTVSYFVVIGSDWNTPVMIISQLHAYNTTQSNRTQWNRSSTRIPTIDCSRRHCYAPIHSLFVKFYHVTRTPPSQWSSRHGSSIGPPTNSIPGSPS